MNDFMKSKDYDAAAKKRESDLEKRGRMEKNMRKTGRPVDESWRFAMEPQKRERALRQIREAVEKKKIRYQPSILACLQIQFRFQPIGYWFFQAFFLAAAFGGMHYFSGKWENEQVFFVSLSVFFTLGANFALSGLGHLFSKNMAELYKTLYWDLKQMVCIQFLLAGIMDILLLTVLAVCSGPSYGAAFQMRFLCYLLVPFCWANSIYLALLVSLRGTSGKYWRAIGGILSAFLAIMPIFWENAYDLSFFPLWGIFLAAGVLLLALEAGCLFRKIEKGDLLCLN